MALIAMAVYDTVENKRTSLTALTLECLANTVDFSKHRLIIVDNDSCHSTLTVLWEFIKNIDKDKINNRVALIQPRKNLGTAEAINQAWKFRLPEENAIKMDNDVIIHSKGWIEDMEATIARDPQIGQVGLKRKDCWENPDHKDPFYKSTLSFLPHSPGESWIPVEEVNHVMGTCVMHSAKLLNTIGYLYQPKLYGFDDSFMSLRSKLAGFRNVFLPYINIDHIDTDPNEYQKWKEKHAASCWQEYHKIVEEYRTGKRPLYYEP